MCKDIHTCTHTYTPYFELAVQTNGVKCHDRSSKKLSTQGLSESQWKREWKRNKTRKSTSNWFPELSSFLIITSHLLPHAWQKKLVKNKQQKLFSITHFWVGKQPRASENPLEHIVPAQSITQNNFQHLPDLLSPLTTCKLSQETQNIMNICHEMVTIVVVV